MPKGATMAAIPSSILCVCLGNICRSPTAEAVLRARATARGLDLTLDSAGTGDWHRGKPPHAPAIAAGRARGYDLGPLRARQARAADFDDFDLILAMDRRNLADLTALRPAGNTTPLRLLAAGQDIPDPYYTGDFEAALDLIEQAADILLDELHAAKDPSA